MEWISRKVAEKGLRIMSGAARPRGCPPSDDDLSPGEGDESACLECPPYALCGEGEAEEDWRWWWHTARPVPPQMRVP